MKLEPGRNNYPIEQSGRLLRAIVDTGGNRRSADMFVLMPISLGAISTMIDSARDQSRGRPVYVCDATTSVLVWPAPDESYDLLVTIQPYEVTL